MLFSVLCCLVEEHSNRKHSQRQEQQAERPCYEDGQRIAGHYHRVAEIRFHQITKNYAEDDRYNTESKLAQQAALTAAGAEKIYTDTFTGTKMDRPEWDRLRAQLRRGDVLIVTRLDRLARSVSQASGMITEMIDEGITINVLNLGILSNDSVNTLLRNVLLSFAQFERDMIVQRTQEGKAVARATDPDFREGRPPKFDTEQLDHAMELLENHSYTQVVKLTGISKSTLIREKKRRQA